MDAPRRPTTSRPSIRKNRALHPCTTCGKSFTKRSNMLIHARLHTGETPYVCKYAGCGRSYKWLSSINFHENRCDRRNFGLAVPAPRPPPPPAAAEAARIARQQQTQLHRNVHRNLPPPLPGYASLHMTATGRSPTPPPQHPPPPPPPPLRPPLAHPSHHLTHHYPFQPHPHVYQQQSHHQQHHHPHHFTSVVPHSSVPYQDTATAAAPPAAANTSTRTPTNANTSATTDPAHLGLSTGAFTAPAAYSTTTPPSYNQYATTTTTTATTAAAPLLPIPSALDLSLYPHQPQQGTDTGFHTPRSNGKRFRGHNTTDNQYQVHSLPFSPLTSSPSQRASDGPGLSLALASYPSATTSMAAAMHKKMRATGKSSHQAKSSPTTSATTAGTAILTGQDVDDCTKRILSFDNSTGQGKRNRVMSAVKKCSTGAGLPASPESACSVEVRDMLAPNAPAMLLSGGNGARGGGLQQQQQHAQQQQQQGQQQQQSNAESGSEGGSVGEGFGLTDEDMFMGNCTFEEMLDDLASEEYGLNGLDNESAAESIGLFQ